MRLSQRDARTILHVADMYYETIGHLRVHGIGAMFFKLYGAAGRSGGFDVDRAIDDAEQGGMVHLLSDCPNVHPGCTKADVENVRHLMEFHKLECTCKRCVTPLLGGRAPFEVN